MLLRLKDHKNVRPLQRPNSFIWKVNESTPLNLREKKSKKIKTFLWSSETVFLTFCEEFLRNRCIYFKLQNNILEFKNNFKCSIRTDNVGHLMKKKKNWLKNSHKSVVESGSKFRLFYSLCLKVVKVLKFSNVYDLKNFVQLCFK